MKKHILISLIIISFFSCKNESIKQKNGFKEDKQIELVKEEKIYEVINFVLDSIIKHSEENTNYVTGETMFFMDQDSTDYFGISKMDSIFSEKDVKFILQQRKIRMDFNLKNDLLKNKIVIPKDTLVKFSEKQKGASEFWDKFWKKYGNKGFYSISKPLFSLDNKTVIITFGINCGSLCGEWKTVIYKKTKHKWKLIKVLQITVS